MKKRVNCAPLKVKAPEMNKSSFPHPAFTPSSPVSQSQNPHRSYCYVYGFAQSKQMKLTQIQTRIPMTYSFPVPKEQEDGSS